MQCVRMVRPVQLHAKAVPEVGWVVIVFSSAARKSYARSGVIAVDDVLKFSQIRVLRTRRGVLTPKVAACRSAALGLVGTWHLPVAGTSGAIVTASRGGAAAAGVVLHVSSARDLTPRFTQGTAGRCQGYRLSAWR